MKAVNEWIKPRWDAGEDQLSDSVILMDCSNAEGNLSGPKHREIWIKQQYFLKQGWTWNHWLGANTQKPMVIFQLDLGPIAGDWNQTEVKQI